MIDLLLNLSTQQDYLSSLALIRQRITVGRDKHDLPAALRFAIRLPYDMRVEVFMQTSNLYLIGFRGANKVYALEDEKEDFAAAIRASGRLDSGEQVVMIGQRGDHRSLGTFERPFNHGDLANCSVLAIYTDAQENTMIRRPFALLVCMLCEGARFLQVQNDFAGVGHIPGRYFAGPIPGGGVWGDSVDANEIVKYWSNATRARTVAEHHGVGVTEGHRKAKELKTGVDDLEAMLSRAGVLCTRSALYGWISGQPQPDLKRYESLQGISSVLTRLQALTRALKLNDVAAVSEFIVALQNEIAVQASLGLLLPAVQ
jgi:hypothetical protein